VRGTHDTEGLVSFTQMPVRPVRLDAEASRVSIESIQLTIAQLDMSDHFILIGRRLCLTDLTGRSIDGSNIPNEGLTFLPVGSESSMISSMRRRGCESIPARIEVTHRRHRSRRQTRSLTEEASRQVSSRQRRQQRYHGLAKLLRQSDRYLFGRRPAVLLPTLGSRVHAEASQV
jgi:hypothetical protein